MQPQCLIALSASRPCRGAKATTARQRYSICSCLVSQRRRQYWPARKPQRLHSTMVAPDAQCESTSSSSRSVPNIHAEEVRKLVFDGAQLALNGDLAAAFRCFYSGLGMLDGGCDRNDHGDLRRQLWEQVAYCHSQEGDLWKTLVALERAKLGGQQSIAGLLLGGFALVGLGLLDAAAKSFKNAQIACCMSEEGQDAAEQCAAIQERLHSIDDGDVIATQEEFEKLKDALPEEQAKSWIQAVRRKCQNIQGQEECIQNGFLEKDWLNLPPEHYTLRALHKTLLFQVKKNLQNLILPLRVSFATPASLQFEGLEKPLLTDPHWADLLSKGLVVVDNVFKIEEMRQLRQECEAIDKAGMLKSDPDDLCNPLSRSIDIPFEGRDANLHMEVPVLRRIMACLRGLCTHCENKLNLELRVPQTLMLSCYGEGAYYRKHMDSYEGKDIPRKITILLYANPDWKPSDEGKLRVWVDGKSMEYSPCAGRLVIFMSQDIPHEVLHSKRDRYCLTVWIWDVIKDDFGR